MTRMISRSGAVRLLVYTIMIVSAATAAAALVVWLRDRSMIRDAAAEPVTSGTVLPDTDPVAAEADVFRTTAADLAIEPDSKLRRPAHPRTLATYRNLRAYPGSPPRIPVSNARCSPSRGAIRARTRSSAAMTAVLVAKCSLALPSA